MKSSVHVLFVAWQDPESRRIFPIARLLRRVSGLYEFAYVRAVREAEAHGFVGLPGFEDVERVYSSPELPELFARRGARPPRPKAPSASSSLPPEGAGRDLIDATPISVFVRRPEQVRAERLEVFAPPLLDPDGGYWGVFEARGVGRGPGSLESVQRLVPGEQLALRAEPDNAYNPAALLIERASGEAVGYVPDYLANEVAYAAAPPSALGVKLLGVERVTFAPAAPVYRVSCRYHASVELGRRLFASDRYDLIARPARPLVE